jgi:hypothetical protein
MAMETHFTALGRHTHKEEKCGSMEKHIFLITLFGNLCFNSYCTFLSHVEYQRLLCKLLCCSKATSILKQLKYYRKNENIILEINYAH